MQITSGLISCDPNVDNSAVFGNASVDWTLVTANCILIVGGTPYTITSVNPTLKILTISPAWVGVAVSNVAYVIVRDFTLLLQLPLLNPGDLEAAAIFSRAMRQLDSLGTSLSTDPTVSDYPITTGAPHGFIVGNALYLSGTTWIKCHSSSAAASRIVGMVSRVVDANTFWIRFTGSVGGSTYPITYPSITAGDIYYLRASIAGDGSNIGVLANAGTTAIPVAQGASSNSVYLLNFARAESSTFTETQPGLVPAHNSPSTTKLLYSTGWGDATGLSDASIKAQHLSPTPALAGATATAPEWAGFQARTAGVAVHPFIMDLQTRLLAAESAVATSAYTATVFTRRTNTSGNWSWTKPAGVAFARITIFCGETRGNGTPTAFRGDNDGKQVLLPIASGVSFRLDLTGVTALSGFIKPYFTSLLKDGAAFCSIGWDGITSFASYFASPQSVSGNIPVSFAGTFVSPTVKNVRRLREHLVAYHYPEYTAMDVSMLEHFPVPTNPTYVVLNAASSTTGFFYIVGKGHFSGVVQIETGLGV